MTSVPFSYNWGFIGTGRVTRRMAEAVRQAVGATLVGIASRDLERATAWAAERRAESTHGEHEFIKAYAGYDSILMDPAIDWIYIALPPSLHHRWTIEALAAGKNVLCEKPLCLNAIQAKEVASAAHQYRRRLVHASAFPYHPRSTAAQALVRSSELNGIRRIHVACSFAGIYSRGEDHRTEYSLGGGCLLDLGWYCVLATLWFTGLDCVRLRAIGSKRDGVWYQIQVLAEMSNGAIAHWDCGFDAAPRRWIEIAGSEASWICDDFLRPLDTSKPRFWVHGQEGKARTEIIGEGVFQEAMMIEACQASDPNNDLKTREDNFVQNNSMDEQLSLAIQTHCILDCIEQSAESGSAISL